MPSVTINEIDNTIVQQTPSSYNTTLIFGGSTFGPANTPTRLTSLADLSIFGEALEGTYSYETAKNVIRLGYPVLFTRITDNETVDDKTYLPTSGYAYTDLYGHIDMKDKSLTDYIILDNQGTASLDFGYKVDTSYATDADVESFTQQAPYPLKIKSTFAQSSGINVEDITDIHATLSVKDNNVYTPVVNISEYAKGSTGNYIQFDIKTDNTGTGASAIQSREYKDFRFTAYGTYDSEELPIAQVDFSCTENESAVRVNARYTGSYGNKINLNLYRVALAKTDSEREQEKQGTTVLTNYQYNLKIYVGNSLVETFKLMTYRGTGYNRGPEYDSSSLGEDFDKVLGKALADATAESKYINVVNKDIPGCTSDFHTPEHLKELDQIVENTETHTTSYKVNLINLSSTEGTYDDSNSVGKQLFKLSSNYIQNTTTETVFNKLEDKYTYDFRFVTTAGFCKISDDPDFNKLDLYDAIKKLCYTRGDAFGILDVEKDLELTATELNDYLPVRQYEQVDDSYIAYYCPWGYGMSVDGTNKWLPPSYWFLQTLFTNVNNGGQVYNPPAGVKRMRVAGIQAISSQIGGVTLDELQDENANHVRINPIMSLRNYGYVVYGLRTAYALSPPYELSKKSALQQPHVRIVANEIKSVIFDTALGLTFDNNNLITWNSFKSTVEATLSSMQVNNALNDYEIIMDETIQTSDRKVIYGSVKISVFEAVEDFIIDFQLDPSTVTYGENTTTL